MRKSFTITLTILFLVLIWFACDLPTEPGPMPKTIIDTDFVPGLNVFSVLRLDGQPGSSFLYVERVYETEEMAEEAFSPVIKDAEVIVRNEQDQSSFLFIFEEDSIRGAIYKNDDFLPVESNQYSLTITVPELPNLFASTVIPVKPSIDSTSLKISDRSLSFILYTSQNTDSYDIYLFLSNGSLHQRIVNPEQDELKIQFDFPVKKGTPLWIEIYGYDPNLSEYLSSSITLKPQTYYEMVNPVSNGYGCFGSVSKTTIIVF